MRAQCISWSAARLGVLLIEADRIIPGRFDSATGEVRPGRLADPEVGHVIDDLAEAALLTGGEVVVVPVNHILSGQSADVGGHR